MILQDDIERSHFEALQRHLGLSRKPKLSYVPVQQGVQGAFELYF